MKVRELIKELNRLDPNKEVIVDESMQDILNMEILNVEDDMDEPNQVIIQVRHG